MAFQAVTSTAEAVLRLTINGELVTNTFYGFKADGYDQGDIDNLAAGMDEWVDAEFLDLFSNQATYLGVNVRGLTLENDLEAFDGTNTGVGNVAAAPTPNNVTKAFKRYTGLTGRSARGRVYFPLHALMIDATDENRIGTGAATNILAALNQVRTAMIAAGFTEVVVSRYNAGELRTAGVVFPVVNYQNTTAVLNTQRRRLPNP